MQKLSSKDFDFVKEGYCIGCNCGCRYLAYIKNNSIVDITGHPSDKLGMGSFCTKGIALIQELPFSSFRLKAKKPMDIKSDTAIYVDRFTTDKELKRAFSFTEDVYSDMLYVENARTFEVEHIPNKQVILNISEPSFYDVMLARWIIDASQKGAKLFNLGVYHTNMSSKAKYNNILKPQAFLSYLESIEKSLEKGLSEDPFIDKFINASLKLGNALIIIQDTYIRFDKDYVFGFLEKLNKNYKIDYIITGNVTTWPVKPIEGLQRHNDIINLGDMFRFLPNDMLEEFSKKNVLSLSHMANMSVNLSKYYLPRKCFIEYNFTKKTAFLDISSDKILENKETYTLLDIIPQGDKNINFNIKSQKQEPIKDKTLLIFPSVVDDLGHYSRWLHEIEPHQYIYINPSLAKSIDILDDELLEIETSRGKAVFRVKISANLSDDAFLISNAYDEYQPFYEGVRPGTLAIDKDFVPVLRYRKL